MTIEVLNNVNNKKHKTKWFLDKYNPFLFFVENQDSYDWVPFNFPILFYKKRERYTKIIDLTKSSEEIFKGFSSTTRNEIHKIQKLSASINYDENPIKVFNVTNNMFKQKGLNNLCDYSINPQNKLLCTSIKFDSFFVCHSYLINEDKSTIVLFTSASEYRELDGKKKNLNSQLNRYLHYMDMLYFKNLGFKFYDLGCVGFKDEYESKNRDASLNGIIKFKESFGGKLFSIWKYEKMHKMQIIFLGVKISFNLDKVSNALFVERERERERERVISLLDYKISKIKNVA